MRMGVPDGRDQVRAAFFGRLPAASVRFVFAAMLLGSGSPAAVRAQEVWPLECDTCSQPEKIGLAAAQVVFVNVAVNAYNQLNGRAFADVSPASWLRNIDVGWEWDDNHFDNNFFKHPYHGSLYYNAARSNGFGFWASTPFVFAGSLMWEYLAETHLPAQNDFFATSLGGIVLGEMLYRTSSLVIDNGATGVERVGRELGAAVLNPMRGFNRLIHGDMFRTGANPSGGRPKWISSVWDIGGRPVGEDSIGGAKRAAFVEFDLFYGDPMAGDHEKPFASFELRVQLNASDKAPLGRIQVVGLLDGTPLYDPERPPTGARHMTVVTLDYDYANNDAYEIGGQSLGIGLLSQYRLGGRFALSTRFIPRAWLFGAINNPFTSVGARDYDYGAGLGLNALVAVWHARRQVFEAYYWGLWQHTLHGTAGDHLVHFAGARVRVPIVKFFGVGAEFIYARRHSTFRGFPNLDEDGTQLRFFLTFFTD